MVPAASSVCYTELDDKVTWPAPSLKSIGILILDSGVDWQEVAEECIDYGTHKALTILMP